MNRRVLNYYARSIVCLSLALAGCGAGPNQMAKRAGRVDFQELNGPDKRGVMKRLTHFPSIIHFKAGDRVPVEFIIDSELAEVEVKDMVLVAKRDFYLLLRPRGGPRLSRDGVNFEEGHKNWFSIGFAVTRREPAHLAVKLGVWPPQARK